MKLTVYPMLYGFLSTLSLRRATRTPTTVLTLICISIHALLAESDIDGISLIVHVGGFLSTLSLRRATEDANNGTNTNLHFYPRSPCGERLMHALILADPMLFLSTLSLRRATNCTSIGRPKRLYFYPRSPCGERRETGSLFFLGRHFYPRSPCGERPTVHQ